MEKILTGSTYIAISYEGSTAEPSVLTMANEDNVFLIDFLRLIKGGLLDGVLTRLFESCNFVGLGFSLVPFKRLFPDKFFWKKGISTFIDL